MAKSKGISGAAKPAVVVEKKPAPVVEPAAAASSVVVEPVAAAPAAVAEPVAAAPTPAAAAAVAAVPEAKTKAAAKKDDLRDGVFVKSVPVSIRRCGFRFDRDGCGVALDLLTEDQLQQLENDPDLIVERCQFPMNESA